MLDNLKSNEFVVIINSEVFSEISYLQFKLRISTR